MSTFSTRLFSGIALFLLSLKMAYGNLLISPTHLVLEDRQRSNKITLINSGQHTQTYRLVWKTKQAQPQGGYQDIDPNSAPLTLRADTMIRFSPRQVTLAPGQRQTIRVSARRPKDLIDGEYRSHLSFIALPAETRSHNSGISLDVVMNYTMPVMVRHGASKQNTQLITASNEFIGKDKAKFNLELAHQGHTSTCGNLVILWRDNTSDTPREVARINQFRIYPELTQLNVSLTSYQQVPNYGQYQVTFTGLNSLEGQQLFQSPWINIKP
ncbi:fimbrial biogenesis chaperone [Ferrimonas aestuarii]|uniref:Molecular chaperone n=1 Tax=Ferrimonas aestuarii TaxID=2569539 RepID=A0A4U1BMR1_9GAMM|nr:fimbria/pilus periplasmic chaperone [Ferrimonas aestuarii]TKB54953.1 molecular chaperone [Ferrimonas aestuarii]